MDILLAAVNAKYIHTNLAVYSFRAYCREFSQRISLREYTINQEKDQILKIYTTGPQRFCVFPVISGTFLMWRLW